MRNTKYMTNVEIVNDWLKEYEGTGGYYKYREGLQKFLSFLGKDINQVMAEYNAAKDKSRWARDMGLEVVKFYHHLTNEGYSINTARTWTIPARAFFSAKAASLKVKRGAIPRAQVARNEHKFLQQELQEMRARAPIKHTIIPNAKETYCQRIIIPSFQTKLITVKI